MSEIAHDTQQKTILFGALKRLLELGGHHLTITPDGIDVVDRFQNVHPVQILHKPIQADVAHLQRLIQQNRDWSGRSSYLANDISFALSSRIWDSAAFGNLNAWTLDHEESSDDTLVIKPRKRLPVALEQVFKAKPADLNRLRSLYRKGGFTIGIMCRGETRADAVLATLAAERNQVGLDTSVAFSKSRNVYGNEAESLIKTSRIDGIPVSEGDPWVLEACDRRDLVPNVSSKPMPDAQYETARVYVAPYPGNGRYLPHKEAIEKHINQRGHGPSLIITVDVTSDGPVAEFTFSKSLMVMTTPKHEFKDAPWAAVGEQKAKRDAKPKAPKTWFSTTEDVAKSFVSRQAPRGYISSRTIYFHGPIAYSIYDRNPIACILDTPKGKPLLLIGREQGIGGTMAGTVSGACGDIVSAAGNAFQIVHVGDLKEIIRYGGKKLDELPRHFRNDKNEDDFPETASLHKTAFSKWLKAEFKDRSASLEKALETTFATHVKASAYQSLAALIGLRDTIAETYGIALPDLGNAKSYRTKAKAERKAAAERLDDLRERKSASAPRP